MFEDEGGWLVYEIELLKYSGYIQQGCVKITLVPGFIGINKQLGPV